QPKATQSSGTLWLVVNDAATPEYSQRLVVRHEGDESGPIGGTEGSYGARLNVPELNRTVPSGHRQQRAVGRKRHCAGHVHIRQQASDFARLIGLWLLPQIVPNAFPQANHPAHAMGSEQVSLGTVSERGHGFTGELSVPVRSLAASPFPTPT